MVVPEGVAWGELVLRLRIGVGGEALGREDALVVGPYAANIDGFCVEVLADSEGAADGLDVDLGVAGAEVLAVGAWLVELVDELVEQLVTWVSAAEERVSLAESVGSHQPGVHGQGRVRLQREQRGSQTGGGMGLGGLLGPWRRHRGRSGCGR